MKYAWIEQHQDEFRVSARYSGFRAAVTTSGWNVHPVGLLGRTRNYEKKIERSFEQGRGTYGTRRMKPLLR